VLIARRSDTAVAERELTKRVSLVARQSTWTEGSRRPSRSLKIAGLRQEAGLLPNFQPPVPYIACASSPPTTQPLRLIQSRLESDMLDDRRIVLSTFVGRPEIAEACKVVHMMEVAWEARAKSAKEFVSLPGETHADGTCLLWVS
jgi:hypothetical protein